jgi:hypothetical protein
MAAGMFAGCIGVPTDVLTTEDITADIIDRTITGLIVGMCVEFMTCIQARLLLTPSSYMVEVA